MELQTHHSSIAADLMRESPAPLQVTRPSVLGFLVSWMPPAHHRQRVRWAWPAHSTALMEPAELLLGGNQGPSGAPCSCT